MERQGEGEIESHHSSVILSIQPSIPPSLCPFIPLSLLADEPAAAYNLESKS
jgi:hypothetical protein